MSKTKFNLPKSIGMFDRENIWRGQWGFIGTRMGRICTDQIRVNLSNPPNLCSNTSDLVFVKQTDNKHFSASHFLT